MKTWLKLQIGGQKWRVHLVSPKSKYLLDDDNERCEGICEHKTSRIFINQALSEPSREDTLLHELTHAIFYVAGVRSLLNNDEIEEPIVRSMTPVLHRLLSDLGFVFPKVSG